MYPEVKHLALLKHIARYLVDKQECAWQSPEQKPPTKIVAFTDADWASNADDRRSVHVFFGNEQLHAAGDGSQQRGVGVPRGYFQDPHVHGKYDHSFLR